MANKKASLKSVKQTARRTLENRVIVSRLRTRFKKVSELVGANSEGVQEAARDYVSALDKAVKVGVIHHNKASRHKSMMAKFAF